MLVKMIYSNVEPIFLLSRWRAHPNIRRMAITTMITILRNLSQDNWGTFKLQQYFPGLSLKGTKALHTYIARGNIKGVKIWVRILYGLDDYDHRVDVDFF